MNLFKRIKRTWVLANKDKDSLDDFMKLTDKEIMDLPDEDQKAIFFSEGSEEEYKEYENEKKFGTKKPFSL